MFELVSHSYLLSHWDSISTSFILCYTVSIVCFKNEGQEIKLLKWQVWSKHLLIVLK